MCLVLNICHGFNYLKNEYFLFSLENLSKYLLNILIHLLYNQLVLKRSIQTTIS